MNNAVYLTSINKRTLFKSYFSLFFSTVINIVSSTIYPNDTVSFFFIITSQCITICHGCHGCKQ